MKSIGAVLFELSASGAPSPKMGFERVGAKALGLQESWFRDAIFAEPELVIGPCRTGGRVDADEVWIPWRIEVNFGSGPIDVLLLSSHGRIAIVETKLSYNPQRRREVVAQVLDYAISLQESDREDLPDLPDSPDTPLEEDLIECLRTGRFLLIIAGDALDPRALRLSQSMLARHLTSEWDLAMVDLNVYRRQASGDQLLVVPELLGTVQSELRQVVRVIVQGESVKARVVVDKIVNEDVAKRPSNALTSVDEFLAEVTRQTPQLVDVARRHVHRMQQMAANSGGKITFGLLSVSASLYYATPTGPKRFLALRTDGRLRLVLAYLRGAGAVDVVTKIGAAVAPDMTIGASDRAGMRYSAGNEQVVSNLFDRIVAELGA